MFKPFAFGKNTNNKLATNKTERKLLPSVITKVDSIFDIAPTEKFVFFITKTGECKMFGDSTKDIEWKESLLVKKVSVGMGHCVFLMQNQQVYGFGIQNGGQLGMGNKDSVLDRPKLNTKLSDVNIVDVMCTQNNTFFLDDKNQMYVSGLQALIPHGLIPSGEKVQATLIPGIKVSRIFGGPKARHFMYTTTEGKLFGYGQNDYGQCGGSFRFTTGIPCEVPNIEERHLQDAWCGNCSTALIYKNQLYTAGYQNFIGSESSTSVKSFTLVEGLKGETIKALSGGSSHVVVLTDKNELYVFGYNNERQLGEGPDTIKVVKRFTTPLFEPTMPFQIKCGPYCTLIYNRISIAINDDLLHLYESGTIYDVTVNGKRAIKALIDYRTERNLDRTLELLNNKFNKSQTDEFLKWVYSSQISDRQTLESIFKEIDPNIKFFQKLLINDISQIFKDQESMNFALLIKDDEEEDDDDDEELEELPVHKWMLFARSGMFRELFQNVKEDLHSIRDYSNKSVESLEVFLKFLYTEKIELTADHDPQLIYEELSDAAEYYQLNPNCPLKYALELLKSEYNITTEN
ncbi:btk-binding protein-related [Anaeramoeba flamelloides]|uniref:Btk-binding protein-related n=1 Tax=Anaeramoeba flamelloides TaxID=1746091 RepID=A0ABQ8XWQ1_9EUKA|nr:btk-binding protein-related [Anaeramoeba flamelloides]